MVDGTTYIVIPALRPDERLVELVAGLGDAGCGDGIVVVDDGSGSGYEETFAACEAVGATVLRHAENLGKGRALKTAFNHVLVTDPEAVGCVTADCDGQHAVRDIMTVRSALRKSPSSLVMGVRDFSCADVPTKSRIGNAVTRRTFALLCGVSVSDTQTGLRGMPAQLMRECLSMPGERFELEMDMLASCRGRRDVVEIPIETLYDSKECPATHFRPVEDSFRIAGVITRVFVRYALSSLASSIIDLTMFALLSSVLSGIPGIPWIVLSTVIARCVSATFNFTVNWRKVFKTGTDVRRMAIRYAALAVTLMAMSAFVAQVLIPLLPIPPVVTKACVDVGLFAASYAIQGRLVFRESSDGEDKGSASSSDATAPPAAKSDESEAEQARIESSARGRHRRKQAA